MMLTRSLWTRVLEIQAECRRRDIALTRNLLKDSLQLCEHDARFIRDALRFQDIIALRHNTFHIEKETRELILSDIHIPYEDKAALEAALSFGDAFQPDIITLLGDTVDFYQVSTFAKSPLKKSVSTELKLTREFLSGLRYRYPDAKLLFLQGNHEQRADRYLMSQASEIYDLVNDLLEIKLGFKDLGIEYITEPFKIGKLNHLHGHEKGKGLNNPEYITNVVFNFVLDHFVCGHFHRSQDKIFKRIDKSIFLGTSIGYLAGDMEYAQLNKWNQGFATVVYGDSGRFKVQNHKIFNGEVY